jgi:N-acyl-D-aspartate/D-glutamate deacylase
MALAAVGRGWLQIVADFGDGQADEFAMFRRLVEQSGRPMTMTLLQRDAFPDEWRQLLARITEANRDGLSMTGQVRGRPTSTLLGFELSRNPFVDCPSWAEVVELGIDERIAVLSEPEFRSRIIAELSRSGASMDSSPNWKRIFRLGDPPQYEPEPELCVADQAERLGVSPAALAYDWMMEDGGRAILYHPTTNYTAGSMAPVFEMLRHDHTLIGLGDGGAHVGIMCDATDMAHAITHWTRDRSRGDRLPIEDIVRRLSSNNAEALGLTDRGRIALGMKADVNVIDYDRLRLRPPVVRYDLPAGGKRLLQQTDGFDLTMVSGVAVWRHGEATGQLPGRLLRSGDFS